ncbi:MAG: hypothetical protein MUF54_03495 [Polyangiaceae bacterium]|nr:hypothetical protein [Polyangiaceae bacterium]
MPVLRRARTSANVGGRSSKEALGFAGARGVAAEDQNASALFCVAAAPWCDRSCAAACQNTLSATALTATRQPGPPSLGDRRGRARLDDLAVLARIGLVITREINAAPVLCTRS